MKQNRKVLRNEGVEVGQAADGDAGDLMLLLLFGHWLAWLLETSFSGCGFTKNESQPDLYLLPELNRVEVFKISTKETKYA